MFSSAKIACAAIFIHFSLGVKLCSLCHLASADYILILRGDVESIKTVKTQEHLNRILTGRRIGVQLGIG